MPVEELDTLVVYDVPKDKLRRRVYEACKDYGLKRFQFSAFRGPLDRNRRQEIFFRIRSIVGDHTARILVLALCAKDSATVLEHVADNPEDDDLEEERSLLLTRPPDDPAAPPEGGSPP